MTLDLLVDRGLIVVALLLGLWIGISLMTDLASGREPFRPTTSWRSGVWIGLVFILVGIGRLRDHTTYPTADYRNDAWFAVGLNVALAVLGAVFATAGLAKRLRRPRE
jgi:hypothetical protein